MIFTCFETHNENKLCHCLFELRNGENWTPKIQYWDFEIKKRVKNISQSWTYKNFRRCHTVVPTRQNDRISSSNRSCVAKKACLFRVPSSLRWMLQKSVADPRKATQMEKVNPIIIASLYIVMLVRVSSKYNHVTSKYFSSMVSSFRRNMGWGGVRTWSFWEVYSFWCNN